MIISLSDNGGRRVSGDRRLLDTDAPEKTERTGENRRIAIEDRRRNDIPIDPEKERRAMHIFMNTKD